MDFYHLLNRGVEKRDVVLDDYDRFRFVHSLFIFNDSNPIDENHRKKEFLLPASDRIPLVHIHAWCLMSNHYHLLVSPIDNDLTKISKFMKRLNMGYARYFNERYKRSGYLWQGKYKKVEIVHDSHFNYIPYYIHLNPLDKKYPEWRVGDVATVELALEYLRGYRWSSHIDYLGNKNFPSVIDSTLLQDIFGDPVRYVKEIPNIISSPKLTALAEKFE